MPDSIWVVEHKTRNKLASHWQKEKTFFESYADAQEALAFRTRTWKSKEHRVIEYVRKERVESGKP